MNFIEMMAAPFFECLVLVAIHTYLGIHVLRRRVIFVDLALAQTAALGTTAGVMLGIMPDTSASLVFSIVFTFLAAGIFALTRMRNDRIPQEAVIGLFYAIAAALAVLVVQKTPGAEHLESILVGSILWVRWEDVGIAALAYGVIGVVHFVFRKQFLMISEDPDKAFAQGMNVRLWDFLFYVTFGLVISFSVRVAGVLLVFVFLVAPAIMAFMVTNRLRSQLAIGWAMGTLVTVLGLVLSYRIDLPSGPTVVAFYGVVLALGAVVVFVANAERRTRALLRAVAGTVAAALVGLGVYGFGGLLAASSLAQSEDGHGHAAVAQNSEEEQKIREEALREEPSFDDVALLRGRTGDSVPVVVLKKYLAFDDVEKRLRFIEEQLVKDKTTGYALLICFLSQEDTPVFFRSQALDLLKTQPGHSDFGYNAEASPSENKPALDKMIEVLLGGGRLTASVLNTSR